MLFLSCSHTDTLLNVFIAIAVDNLAQAQAMTAAELAAADQTTTQVGSVLLLLLLLLRVLRGLTFVLSYFYCLYFFV